MTISVSTIYFVNYQTLNMSYFHHQKQLMDTRTRQPPSSRTKICHPCPTLTHLMAGNLWHLPNQTQSSDRQNPLAVTTCSVVSDRTTAKKAGRRSGESSKCCLLWCTSSFCVGLRYMSFRH